MLPNYYNILDVPPSANAFEIKKAYRKLAKIYHPDISSDINAKIKFQLINQAYQILINEDKRKFYNTQFAFEQSLKHKYINKYKRNIIYAQKKREEYYKNYNKPTLDKYAFIVMFFIAIMAIIFGIIQLIINQWEGLSSLKGLVIGPTLLIPLIIGYKILHPKEKQ